MACRRCYHQKRSLNRKSRRNLSTWKWQEAIAVGEELCELLEELPEQASDFVESVGEKARAIMATIERSESVTERQRDALENMLAGAEKWMR